MYEIIHVDSALAVVKIFAREKEVRHVRNRNERFLSMLKNAPRSAAVLDMERRAQQIQ
jgi:hypothetical protein